MWKCDRPEQYGCVFIGDISNPGIEAGDGDAHPQTSLSEALKCLAQWVLGGFPSTSISAHTHTHTHTHTQLGDSGVRRNDTPWLYRPASVPA